MDTGLYDLQMTNRSVVKIKVDGSLVPWLQEADYNSRFLLNNVNMKLQGRISACLTGDRNIISKIIVRFPANSIMELYNILLQRYLNLQVVYLKLNM